MTVYSLKKIFEDVPEASTCLKRLSGDAKIADIFVESTQKGKLVFENDRVREGQFHTLQGASARYVKGTQVCSSHISGGGAESVRAALKALDGCGGGTSLSCIKNVANDHADEALFDPREVTEALAEIAAFSRSSISGLEHVRVGYQAERRHTGILPLGHQVCVEDKRQLAILSLVVSVEHNGRREGVSVRLGNRNEMSALLNPQVWQPWVRQAATKAQIALTAKPCPGGEFPIVLGAGIPAVLLHEAIGHGFEGDFNRKKTSVFSELWHQRVASECVTVVDDGSLQHPWCWGSGRVDDEGTVPHRTVLVDRGVMVGRLCDRLNGDLLGCGSTGHGRRQNYAVNPLPRMCNTFMTPGTASLEQLLHRMDTGIYAVDFSGGEVDIVSGQFVFGVCEAYWVEKGRIIAPLKGAMLMGSGLTTLQKIVEVGSDFSWDQGPGFCGKMGQSVVVGLGQPPCLISGMSVGGTT